MSTTRSTEFNEQQDRPFLLLDLPDDVFQEILSYIPLMDRLKTNKIHNRVCKRFSAAHEAVVGWTPNVLIGPPPPPEDYLLGDDDNDDDPRGQVGVLLSPEEDTVWKTLVLPHLCFNKSVHYSLNSMDDTNLNQLLQIQEGCFEELSVNMPVLHIPPTFLTQCVGRWGAESLTTIVLRNQTLQDPYKQQQQEESNVFKWRPETMLEIAKCKHLRKLSLCLDVDCDVFAAASAGRGRTTRESLPSTVFSGLEHLVELAPQLTEFRFNVGPQLCTKDARVISLMVNLKVLELSNRSRGAPANIQTKFFRDLTFLRPLQKQNRLRELHLPDTYIMHARAFRALHDISLFTNLEVLNLTDCPWVCRATPLLKLKRLKRAAFGYHTANVDRLQEALHGQCIVADMCYGVYGEECYQDSMFSLSSEDDEDEQDDDDEELVAEYGSESE